MRSRNIKPGFFSNEILGSADPLYGLLFQGLWCMADREGRLEDRPLRICATIFRYRRKVSEKAVDKMLTWLDEQNFIRRYVVESRQFIQVLEFSKHQRPHSKEAPSIIPPLSSGKHLPRSAPGAHLGNGEHALIPDSGSLIPDSASPKRREEPSQPSTPEPVEGAGLRTSARRRNGSRANGTNPRAIGTNPRAVENASLRAWRAVEPIVDQVKATASAPVAKRLTWDYVRQCVDPMMWEAIEQIGGCRVIADRDRFTTTKIQARFRSAFERLIKIEREGHV